jgi:hypothetical protein
MQPQNPPPVVRRKHTWQVSRDLHQNINSFVLTSKSSVTIHATSSLRASFVIFAPQRVDSKQHALVFEIVSRSTRNHWRFVLADLALRLEVLR